MNSHVQRFYRKFADEQAPIRLYHDVIALHETHHLQWEEIVKIAPLLPKGWHELSRLSVDDRLEFTRDFWLSTIPYIPHAHAFFQRFFEGLDDVGVYLTKQRIDDPYMCEIVYSLRDGSCFYHGNPPCSDKKIEAIQCEFDEVLPRDYLSFLKIHDGFSKHSDTGIIQTESLREVYQQLQREMLEISVRGRFVNPKALIPFYESFGQPSFQCFYTDWNPVEQAGNVYLSLAEKAISDFLDKEGFQEKLAFPTFLDWLIFYLESVE